jgi:hypothetical protein
MQECRTCDTKHHSPHSRSQKSCSKHKITTTLASCDLGFDVVSEMLQCRIFRSRKNVGPLTRNIIHHTRRVRNYAFVKCTTTLLLNTRNHVPPGFEVDSQILQFRSPHPSGPVTRNINHHIRDLRDHTTFKCKATPSLETLHHAPLGIEGVQTRKGPVTLINNAGIVQDKSMRSIDTRNLAMLGFDVVSQILKF